MNDYDKNIGEKIKSFLNQSGMTQKELAEKLQIKPASLNQMLSGRSAFPINRLMAIAYIMQLPEDQKNEIQQLLQEKLLANAGYLNNINHLTASSSSAVLNRLAEEMKAAAVRNAEMRWSRYIADIREITERHFRRFDEQERERVFAEISTHPDRPPAVAVEYMARRIIEQMVPAAAAETKEATE